MDKISKQLVKKAKLEKAVEKKQKINEVSKSDDGLFIFDDGTCIDEGDPDTDEEETGTDDKMKEQHKREKLLDEQLKRANEIRKIKAMKNRNKKLRHKANIKAKKEAAKEQRLKNASRGSFNNKTAKTVSGLTGEKKKKHHKIFKQEQDHLLDSGLQSTVLSNLREVVE